MTDRHHPRRQLHPASGHYVVRRFPDRGFARCECCGERLVDDHPVPFCPRGCEETPEGTTCAVCLDTEAEDRAAELRQNKRDVGW